MENEDRLLNDREAAKLLGMAVQTLRDWRCTGRVELPFVKFGGTVRYQVRDLLDFIESHKAA